MNTFDMVCISMFILADIYIYIYICICICVCVSPWQVFPRARPDRSGPALRDHAAISLSARAPDP